MPPPSFSIMVHLNLAGSGLLWIIPDRPQVIQVAAGISKRSLRSSWRLQSVLLTPAGSQPCSSMMKANGNDPPSQSSPLPVPKAVCMQGWYIMKYSHQVRALGAKGPQDSEPGNLAVVKSDEKRQDCWCCGRGKWENERKGGNLLPWRPRRNPSESPVTSFRENRHLPFRTNVYRAVQTQLCEFGTLS